MLILVLGGGIDKKRGKLPPETEKQLKEAQKLHSQYGGKILVCGKFSPLQENDPPPLTEARAMEKRLLELGEKEVIAEERPADTVSMAYLAKTEHFLPQGESKGVIVTSDFHLERVRYIFTKVFGEKDFDLQYVAVPLSLCCGLGPMIAKKQKELTAKAISLLQDIEPGDHESVKERVN